MISAYESGRRQPGLATLRRLVEASGHVLAVDVVATHPVVPPNTALGRVVSRHRNAVRSVAARHGTTTWTTDWLRRRPDSPYRDREAVKASDPACSTANRRSRGPTWPERDYLTHRYFFDTDHAIVSATVERDLPPLVDAVLRSLER